MPFWAWFLLGGAVTLTLSALWLAWYLKDFWPG